MSLLWSIYSRNSERIERQKARKLKKEKELAKKEERKKERADRAMKKLGAKKRSQRGGIEGLGAQVKKKRLKRGSELDFPKIEGEDQKHVGDKENIAPIQRLFSNKTSVQMTTFIDRRVKTEEFLRSLVEKCSFFFFLVISYHSCPG